MSLTVFLRMGGSRPHAGRKSGSYEKTPSGRSRKGIFSNAFYASLFSFRVMLLFLRAAVFLCRRPLFTAWSTDLTAVL